MQYVEFSASLILSNASVDITDDIATVNIPVADNSDWDAAEVAKVFRQDHTGVITVYDIDEGEEQQKYNKYYPGYVKLDSIKTVDDTIIMVISRGTLDERVDDLFMQFAKVGWINSHSIMSVSDSVIENDRVLMGTILSDITRR